MRFFGRKDEIAELHNIRNLSLHTARFTIVTGRRRSGKTSLLLKAYEDVEDLLYFFVAKNRRKNCARISSTRLRKSCKYLFLETYRDLLIYSSIFCSCRKLAR